MITKFKVFENISNKLKFEDDELVKWTWDKSNDIYSVVYSEYIPSSEHQTYFYTIKNEMDGSVVRDVYEPNLRKLTDEELEDFKIYKMGQKYNL